MILQETNITKDNKTQTVEKPTLKKTNDMEQLTMEELVKVEEKPKKETNWTNLLLGKLK